MKAYVQRLNGLSADFLACMTNFAAGLKGSELAPVRRYICRSFNVGLMTKSSPERKDRC